MSETIEELYQEYVSGKSIEQISKETGKSKWALYKAFQRLRSLWGKEKIRLFEENQKVYREPSGIKRLVEALALIVALAAIYFVYLEIRRKRAISNT